MRRLCWSRLLLKDESLNGMQNHHRLCPWDNQAILEMELKSTSPLRDFHAWKSFFCSGHGPVANNYNEFMRFNFELDDVRRLQTLVQAVLLGAEFCAPKYCTQLYQHWERQKKGNWNQAVIHRQCIMELELIELGRVDPLIAEGYTEIAELHFRMRKYQDAKKNYEQSLEIYEQLHDSWTGGHPNLR
jgi:tetratricopeptide (TPR) repeat protein